MSEIYTVQEGDTIEDLAIQFYGLPTESIIIINANPLIHLQANQIFEGQELIIPDILEVAAGELEQDTGNDDVQINIDGVDFDAFLGFSLKRTIDLAADTFTFSIPWKPDDEQLKETFRPFKYRRVEIRIGGVLKFTGTMVRALPDTEVDNRTLKVSGYSTCGVLNDSNLPINVAHNFKDSTLFEICKLVARPLNVFVRDSVGDLTTLFAEEEAEGGILSGATDFVTDLISPTKEPFEETDIKNTDKIYSFISKLAKKKGILLSSDKFGHLVLQKATSEKAKFTFEEGQPGIVKITANYSGQKGFTSFTGILKGDNKEEVTENDSFTIDNPIMKGVSPRPLVFETDLLEEGGIATATDAKMRRSLANIVSYDAEFKGWRDPDGEFWNDNQRINIKYPGVMIYNTTEFLIKSVSLVMDKDKKITKMSLVLPQSYNDDPVEVLPWD